jgi:hypothetical protein
VWSGGQSDDPTTPTGLIVPQVRTLEAHGALNDRASTAFQDHVLKRFRLENCRRQLRTIQERQDCSITHCCVFSSTPTETKARVRIAKPKVYNYGTLDAEVTFLSRPSSLILHSSALSFSLSPFLSYYILSVPATRISWAPRRDPPPSLPLLTLFLSVFFSLLLRTPYSD